MIGYPFDRSDRGSPPPVGVGGPAPLLPACRSSLFYFRKVPSRRCSDALSYILLPPPDAVAPTNISEAFTISSTRQGFCNLILT